jgi:hypothetical protein
MTSRKFESRVKVQQIIESQLPEFLLSESPKFAEFLKQYYISQEYKSGPTDLTENLDQYLKLDNLTPEVITGFTILEEDISSESNIIKVSSTKGYPQSYGLIKIDDEIITYTGITPNTFTGCIRGFSGITNYHQDLNDGELIFSSTKKSSHFKDSKVENLSSLFIKEFYKKLKFTLTPGLEDIDFVSELNVGNFIKESISLYKSKGTKESFRILFNVLYGLTPTILNQEDFLLKPSSANYIRRLVIVAELISGNLLNLVGQAIFKSTDPNTSASVSEVEIISREGKPYYKISLFIGYDESETVLGNFNITGKTKVVDNISLGSSVITVDSTIGFPYFGSIFTNEGNEIFYTEKSVNQFFGCSGILNELKKTEILRSNETYFGYENGDIETRVEFLITGVISNLLGDSKTTNFIPGEKIVVGSLGDKVENPEKNKTHKQIFANSLIYNTSSRYKIKNIIGNEIELFSDIDRSSLKVNDRVEILTKESEQIIISDAKVISISNKLVSLDVDLSNLNGDFDLRRKLNKSSTSTVPLEYDNITSDIQNLYIENDEYLYVASNSLPSYTINANILQYSPTGVDGFDPNTNTYYILKFENEISFISGDEVYYTPLVDSSSNLNEGSYYVKVSSNKKEVILYKSRSFIDTENYTTFSSIPDGSFTIFFQKDAIISPQKILKKFAIIPNIKNGRSEKTIPGTIGITVNGVEIYNYKSQDKIYYGPIESVNILNKGEDYDVINPPLLVVSSEDGTGCQIQPVVRGKIKKVFVDPQEFDPDSNISVTVTGGNGFGANLIPVITKRRREILFDARSIGENGGLDIINDSILFLKPHNLISGQPVIYNSNENLPIGIGTFLGSNFDQEMTLVNNSLYYAEVLNDRSIRIYPSFSDYVSGINTIGFTTTNNSGIHAFKTEIKNILSEIKVLNGGDGYENRKLIVNSSGISTSNSLITFKDHGFNDGEVIDYKYEEQPIVGLDTNISYRILKVSNDSFRLSNSGIGGTDTLKYQRRSYVKFDSVGQGYHIFSYPNIAVSVSYTKSGIRTDALIESIIATPVVKGGIVDCFVYENGQNYGSNILNFHKKPNITIKNGSAAQFDFTIVNGRIVDVIVEYGGNDYYSTPDINVLGDGTGAEIRPIIENNKIVNAIIINQGVGYSKEKTSIIVSSSGKNCTLEPQVRSLTVNNYKRYGDEIISESQNNLRYSVCGYADNLRQELNDTDISKHSPIIGWAYDGNPIYGGFGYSDPNDSNSRIKTLQSGYALDTNKVNNRPEITLFEPGFFIEDYAFNSSGDLDENNGRFSKTPEFPEGVYAYFSSITTVFENVENSFPYFIGNSYRSNTLSENKSIDQGFNFEDSNLIRNTFPYKIGEVYSGNDFILESNEIIEQSSLIESINTGSVDKLEVINPGNFYKINDRLIFENSDDDKVGGGLVAVVSEIQGKSIKNIDTEVKKYSDVILTWNGGEEIIGVIYPNHDLNNRDDIVISGISSIATNLNGNYEVGIITYSSILTKDIPSTAFVGFVTDIYTSNIPENVSIGSSILIGTEVLRVLNIFAQSNILRVIRESTGVSHEESSIIYFKPNLFTVKAKSNYFDSRVNDLIYFNPVESLGIGTTSGTSVQNTFKIGDTERLVSIQTQSILIPNHPFVTNQEITLSTPDSSFNKISVFDSSSGLSFTIPNPDNNQKLYVINKSKDFIGIVTNVGLTTTNNGLFFTGFTSNPNLGDDYKYSLESNYPQLTATVENIKTTVSLSTSHQLKNKDRVKLSVKPSLSLGVGTFNSVYVKLDELNNKILINPIGFTSSSINTQNSTITILNHNLKTGDKVRYYSGISTNFYYIYKIDDNNINLCETILDTKLNPPIKVGIADSGGQSQELSLVNPQISVVKNNNLVFDLSDSSLSGYKLKIFYDESFKNEFISTGSTSLFSAVGVGTVGISTDSLFTVNYSDELVNTGLFYSIQKDGNDIEVDREVSNFSKITFVDSTYSGDYQIYGIGQTTFQISLRKIPERPAYNQEQCDVIKYSTNSLSDNGPIEKIRIISKGQNYSRLPIFSGSNSANGDGAYIVSKSNSIGKILKSRVIDVGFDYPSDTTLSPSSIVPNFIILEQSNEIQSIEVANGGSGYTFPPKIITINPNTGKKINDGLLTASLSGSSISNVSVQISPKGLPENSVLLRSIDNDNGITIDTIESSSSGIVTCFLTTPLSGFSIDPFQIGDSIFVEGIRKYSLDGTGFNSEDYGYEFFTIVDYVPSGANVKIEFDLSKFTPNPGIANTIQGSYATVIKKSNYPDLRANQIFSTFIEGEKLFVDDGNGYIEQDLYVSYFNKNFIKVSGSYNLLPGQFVKGSQNGSIGLVKIKEKNDLTFEIDYASKVDVGWKDNVGVLNDDIQVIPDNDYYQKLSYTIKSPIEFENFISPVNNLVHISGFKNFADTEVFSSSNAGKNFLGSSNESIIYDIIGENRVDTINNIDFVTDINILDNSSKFLRFQNIKLSDYIEVRTNRVLKIDDISSQFSNKDLELPEYNNLIKINKNEKYNRFLVQVRKSDNSEIEFSDIVVLNNDADIFTLEKSSLRNTDDYRFGNIFGYEDLLGDFYLRFEPKNPAENDYEIKLIKNTINNILPGIGTKSIGLVDLISINKNIQSGITTSIVSFNKEKYSSIHSSIQVINNETNEINYVEIYLSHNNTDSFISEYYFSSDLFNINLIGSFNSSVTNNVVSLNYSNTTSSSITILTKNVGFGSTSLGISTYRFIEFGQIPGNERSAIYSSKFSKNSSNVEIASLNTTEFSCLKSTVRVSYGNTSSLHQVSLVQDGTNIYTTQYPFLSIGSTTGIGTFGGEYNGGNFLFKFYPDLDINEQVEVLSFTESLYTDLDTQNSYPSLTYGSIEESVLISEFFATNRNEGEKTEFNANYNGTPIYKKTFNPNNSNILNPETGEFTILDHFFSDLEELYYRPKSTFIGIGEESLGIGSTENYLGIVTDRLPSKVYVLKDSNNRFRLSTKKEYAQAGIFVTFTSLGEGNSHELEMVKKLEKSIISLDNIIQYPITYAKLSTSTVDNIGIGLSLFALSGITSITTGDFLKINDEFMKVTNIGIGTSSSGPISDIGTVPLVEVSRGSVGTISTTHSGITTAYVYRGSINIVGNKIFFSDPPLGGADEEKYQAFNLTSPRSSFNGRVFLRKDYTSNLLYDNISSEFTGIDQNYELTIQGISTIGIGTTGGNGIVFLNNVFQTPTTGNNPENNYSISEDESIGISSIVFSGITTDFGKILISEYDVNQNQLPRGGIIVSLGSTPGLGFAPLVGASVTAILNGTGEIIGISTSSNFGSGYNGQISIGITDISGGGASLSAVVGAGGTLIFNINSGGFGYTNPYIEIPTPTYSNLPVTGVSRLGIGSTTDTGTGLLLDIEVGSSSTTGIGSTLFEVTSFKISRPGYGFSRGDVFKPIGLVTALGIPSIIDDFQITVLDTFTDSFSSWQFGELDYIDSIKNLQDGKRVRFPLRYNSEILSFEVNKDDPDSQVIEFDALLVIFINGILQNPGESYRFTGGSILEFVEPPKIEDRVDIFFYQGTRGLDSIRIETKELLKSGDFVQVSKNNNLLNITKTQDSRLIENIISSDVIETNLYLGEGIDETNPKPISWTKQKIDRVINGDIVYKSRNSISASVYPTSKIIKNVSSTDTQIFVDDASLFNYENDPFINFDAILISGKSDPVSAELSANVSIGGTIESISILSGGSGYVGSLIEVKIAPPLTVGVSTLLPMGAGIGIGETATAIASISNGQITNPITITNPGLGYSIGLEPSVIVPLPKIDIENISSVTSVIGFSGSIVGITTSNGISPATLSLKFTVNYDSSLPFSDLQLGYPIYVSDTTVGSGITSIDYDNMSLVGIGTNFVDNVYYVHAISSPSLGVGIITCNILSTTSVMGISTAGNYVGKFSWGRLSGFARSSSPVSIAVTGNTIDVGLSTFPTIQRRNYGLRQTGALTKFFI